jgi:hypothetical protein
MVAWRASDENQSSVVGGPEIDLAGAMWSALPALSASDGSALLDCHLGQFTDVRGGDISELFRRL